jgi:hypothetical protein
VVVLAVVASVAVWWWSPEQRFRRSDPDGYRACQILGEGLESKNTRRKLNAIIESAEHAVLAETDAIENAVQELGPGVPPIADVKAMEKACEDAGYEIPEAVSSD